tara:strand:- start:1061 stop:1699 length:639 start_codon:yes stop_codon:yes gene_type:complete
MSTLRTITDFKTALQGGGARPNLFEVDIPVIPTVAEGIDWDADTFKFLCKAAALPASNVAPIDVPFRGRILKVAGDRTFDTWTVTVINDEDFKLRSAFELWMNGISKLDNNTGATQPSSYMANAIVHQLGRGADKGRHSKTNSDIAGGTAIKPLRTYMFNDIFPTNISQIDLSYDTGDTIEEYTVEFQVQYWTAGSAQTSGGATDQAGVSIS